MFAYFLCIILDADVVSWDYSMNESGGVSEGIEAYLRQTLTMSNAPMFIAKVRFAL